jgi:hypothetical protein
MSMQLLIRASIKPGVVVMDYTIAIGKVIDLP